MWKFAKEAVVCVATIFIRTFGMQLLVKKFNVKAESLIQTEAISMWSPLGLIISYLPCKYHEPVLRTGNEVTRVLLSHVAPLTQDSGPSGSGSFLRFKYFSNDKCAMLLEEHV